MSPESNNPVLSEVSGTAASSADRASSSDLKRAFTEDGANKTHVGGQALIEGIMMRGKFNWSVAVREPSGAIYTEEHELASGKEKNKWMYWPLIRGCRSLVESLMLSFKALEVATNHAYGPEGETFGNPITDEEREKMRKAEEKARAKAEKKAAKQEAKERKRAQKRVQRGESTAEEEKANAARRAQEAAAAEPESEELEFGHGEMVFSMVVGLVMGIGLFIVVPALVANLLIGEYDQHTLAWNIVDGVLRVAIFVFYIWLIGRMKDIKRMFGYHGAEHKAIHCFEHGLPMTPENARRFPRLHVRCGTAFLIMVMIIAILVYTITPLNALIDAWGVPDGPLKLTLVIAVRILLMPIIAGVSYEITVKWAGSHPENPLVKIVLWPGMQMQYLTTREPDDGELECAIAAMKLVLEREEREEAAKAADPAEASGSEAPAVGQGPEAETPIR